MTRSTRKLRPVIWACAALLAAILTQSGAAVVLCVASDHVAVEVAHDDGPCAETRHGAASLGDAKTSCSDTRLSVSTPPAPPERVVVAPSTTAALVARAPSAAPLAIRARTAPPRELDRARSSTVLRI